ncbi:hypothetical protein [Carboxylicivirga linearis]|uniref:DUF4145 domain-containing protein n=1 Tax=Carboxylicivirga linearis TaxID=1628157 RepID=A0ABS5JUT6_9BACT|nr:hypothetical protein [Carboxylicivirga linearis]MBS2098661.1 hypothetical protein [Carboxylicivirga linearis]
MDYEKDLINELLHPDVYMFENYMRGINELEGVANQTLKNSDSIEARITSLFIYYQITEEVLAFVLRYCDLITRGSLYPIRFTKKMETRVGFTESLKEIEKSIEFESKAELLAAAQHLGELRNELGHKIVSDYSTPQFDCEDEIQKVQELFAIISECQLKAQIWFVDEIKRIRTRKSIHILIKKYS